MSDQDDQNYALMAAAAAGAYAQKKARDEARKALIISTALNQNMSSLDPKTQAELQQLLQAEARRIRQENFEWVPGWWILGNNRGRICPVFPGHDRNDDLSFLRPVVVRLQRVGILSYARSDTARQNTSTSSAGENRDKNQMDAGRR